MKAGAALLAAIVALAAGLAFASGRTAKPVVLIERPGQCVEATEIMRRDHMKLLLHQRERTVLQGVRTVKHRLTGCVECHASSKTASVLGEQGFCQSCHDYAGVRPDCFECHASKPGAQRAGAKP